MIQPWMNIWYSPSSTFWKKVADSACSICTSTPRLSRHISTIAAVPGPDDAPVPLSAIVMSGQPVRPAVARLLQELLGALRVERRSLRVSRCTHGKPGIMMPVATGIASWKIALAICSRSMASANASRTSGSSNGSALTLKPM